ncbi:hypothetical protein SAY86_001194 [Trapa natans]|uniref:Uncharacterized protein n=1 Tax=Trapa natans TaxID=22666 RepID=A0AAN7MG52_TRANT|nr:hypothetical protein SAY86_001194 [Trapa natans]
MATDNSCHQNNAVFNQAGSTPYGHHEVVDVDNDGYVGQPVHYTLRFDPSSYPIHPQLSVPNVYFGCRGMSEAFQKGKGGTDLVYVGKERTYGFLAWVMAMQSSYLGL